MKHKLQSMTGIFSLMFCIALVFALALAGCPADDGESLATLSGEVSISPAGPVAPNTELTATYSGSETVTFQWKKGGSNAGTASATIPNKFFAADAGTYTVIVSAKGYKSKTSNPVTVDDSIIVYDGEIKGSTWHNSGMKRTVFSETSFEIFGDEINPMVQGISAAAETPWGSGSYTYNEANRTMTLTLTKIKGPDGNLLEKNAYMDAMEQDAVAGIARDWENVRNVVLRDILEPFDWGGSSDPYGFKVDWNAAWEKNNNLQLDEYRVTWMAEKAASDPATKAEIDKKVDDALKADGSGTLEAHTSKYLQQVGHASIDTYKAEKKTDAGKWFIDPVTFNYSFTENGYMLVQKALPASVGTNALSGKTFIDQYDYDYVFTASGYSTENWMGAAETGAYAWDTVKMLVYLQPSKIGGKTMLEYFKTVVVFGGDGDGAKAGQTNWDFAVKEMKYTASNELEQFDNDFWPF